MLAERLYSDGDKFVGAWNFGPSDENLWTVKRVVETFCGANGPLIEFESSTENQKKEKALLSLDSSKAKTHLNWRTNIPVATFLVRARRWYEMSIEGEPADLLCQQELEHYQSFSSDQ